VKRLNGHRGKILDCLAQAHKGGTELRDHHKHHQGDHADHTQDRQRQAAGPGIFETGPAVFAVISEYFDGFPLK